MPDSRRRAFLTAFIGTALTVVGGGLSTVLGAFALRPSRASVGDRWVRAGGVADLTANIPVPRLVSVPEVDGWYRERARHAVFVVWDGDRTVHALSGTCTHLGCQVGWDAESKKFRCPCHGGVYDADGRVVSGPPPRPLDRLDADLRDNGDVMVKL